MSDYLKTKKIGKKLWVLTEPYKMVPKGFITDGASVPKLFHSFLAPMTGLHAEAAVIHDYRYSLDSPSCTQEKADFEFYTNMHITGVNRLKSALVYSTVSIFGKKSFRKKHSALKLNKSYKKYQQHKG